jgi:hypothetical protein
MKKPLEFTEAISSYNRTANQEYIALDEKERKQIVESSFPAAGKAAHRKRRIGTSRKRKLMLRVAGIQDAPSRQHLRGQREKLLIHKERTGDGWFFDFTYASFEQAWEAVRGVFVKAFDLA